MVTPATWLVANDHSRRSRSLNASLGSRIACSRGRPMIVGSPLARAAARLVSTVPNAIDSFHRSPPTEVPLISRFSHGLARPYFSKSSATALSFMKSTICALRRLVSMTLTSIVSAGNCFGSVTCQAPSGFLATVNLLIVSTVTEVTSWSGRRKTACSRN